MPSWEAQGYPQQEAGPGAGPLYTPNQDAAMWAKKKSVWECLKQIHIQETHIDAALLDRFLQLISTNYKADFNLVKNRNLNMSFVDCYQWFLTTYAHADKSNRA